MYCDYVLQARGGGLRDAHAEPLRSGIAHKTGIGPFANRYGASSALWKNLPDCQTGFERSDCSTQICAAEFSRWQRNTPLCSSTSRWEFCYYNLADASAREMMVERNKRLRDTGQMPITQRVTLEYWYAKDFWTSVEHFLASDYAEQTGETAAIIKSEDGIAPFSEREIMARKTGLAFGDIRREETAALELLLSMKSPAEVAAISTQLTVTDPVGREIVGQIGQSILPTTPPPQSPAGAAEIFSTPLTSRPAPGRISAESLGQTSPASRNDNLPPPPQSSSPVSSFAPGGGASGAGNNASDGSGWLLLAFAALKFFLAR